MARGLLHLTIAVGLDSGSGEIVGLAGSMTLKAVGGKHEYEIEDSLPGRD